MKSKISNIEIELHDDVVIKGPIATVSLVYDNCLVIRHICIWKEEFGDYSIVFPSVRAKVSYDREGPIKENVIVAPSNEILFEEISTLLIDKYKDMAGITKGSLDIQYCKYTDNTDGTSMFDNPGLTD